MCTAASVTSSSAQCVPTPDQKLRRDLRKENKANECGLSERPVAGSAWTPFPPVRDNPTLPLSQKPTHFHPLARPNLEVLLESVWESILGIFKAIAYVLRFL